MSVFCNGVRLGKVENSWGEMMPFGVDFKVPNEVRGPWEVEFRTLRTYRPSAEGASDDSRGLGFALMFLTASMPAVHRVPSRELNRFRKVIERCDRLAAKLPKRRLATPPATLKPGISVVIPERDNADELRRCLASLQCSEPIQIIVIVNGSNELRYQELCADFPKAEWLFFAGLGFSEAVEKATSSAARVGSAGEQ